MKNKRMSALLSMVGAVLFFIGCGSSAHIEKDNNVQLSNYKTYNWIPKEQSTTKKQAAGNTIAEQNIKNSTEQALEKKGFKKVSENPDLLLSYDVLIDKKNVRESDPIYSTPYSRLYYNPYSRRYSSLYFPSQLIGYDNRTSMEREGTVTISMIDAKTDKTIWQGWSSEPLGNNYLTSKEAEKDVRLIFKKFNVSQ